MDTPSTRNVTITTLTPETVVGIAVSCTMRFTVAPGEASVMEEAVAAVLELEELELLLMLMLELLLLLVLELLLELEELELLLIMLELLELLELLVVVAAAVAVGVVVLLPPQAASAAAHTVLMMNSAVGLDKTRLKASYIRDSPCQGKKPGRTVSAGHPVSGLIYVTRCTLPMFPERKLSDSQHVSLLRCRHSGTDTIEELSFPGKKRPATVRTDTRQWCWMKPHLSGIFACLRSETDRPGRRTSRSGLFESSARQGSCLSAMCVIRGGRR
jgi:hypothetical protein